MIGIPQAPAPALFHLPFFQKLPPCPVIQLAKLLAQHFGIDPARRAYAAIPGQNLLAQIARRLRALYDHLLDLVDAPYVERIALERRLLDEALVDHFPDERERAILSRPDRLGLGSRP